MSFVHPHPCTIWWPLLNIAVGRYCHGNGFSRKINGTGLCYMDITMLMWTRHTDMHLILKKTTSIQFTSSHVSWSDRTIWCGMAPHHDRGTSATQWAVWLTELDRFHWKNLGIQYVYLLGYSSCFDVGTWYRLAGLAHTRKYNKEYCEASIMRTFHFYKICSVEHSDILKDLDSSARKLDIPINLRGKLLS